MSALRLGNEQIDPLGCGDRTSQPSCFFRCRQRRLCFKCCRMIPSWPSHHCSFFGRFLRPSEQEVHLSPSPRFWDHLCCRKSPTKSELKWTKIDLSETRCIERYRDGEGSSDPLEHAPSTRRGLFLQARYVRLEAL
jgi:hypothetical protein